MNKCFFLLKKKFYRNIEIEIKELKPSTTETKPKQIAVGGEKNIKFINQFITHQEKKPCTVCILHICSAGIPLANERKTKPMNICFSCGSRYLPKSSNKKILMLYVIGNGEKKFQYWQRVCLYES